MPQKCVHIYVDESGDNKLGNDLSSPYFYLAAVIVGDREKALAEADLESISSRFCSGGQIKSSRIAGKQNRRLELLQAIRHIKFSYYGLIVNKSRINRDSGYQWKTTFYKTTSRRLYMGIQALYPEKLIIHRDRIGSTDYMESFAKYLEDLTRPNLFQQTEHDFERSNENRLLQLADLLAGTLGYCFDSSKTSDFSPRFRSLLAEKEISLDVWPPTLDDVAIPLIPDDEADKDLQASLLRQAVHHLSRLESSGLREDKLREHILSKLLFARIYGGTGGSAIYAERLMQMLVDAGFERLSKQIFGSMIIGKLRDAGVIIAGTPSGYKLALSRSDIEDYLKFTESVLLPMMNRVEIARKAAKAATSNTLDILQTHETLKSVVACCRDSRIAERAEVVEDATTEDGAC